MAIELHHLHPGHDDELSRLKVRIAELEKENQTLAEDVSDKIESITELMELVKKYKSEKADLEEERRWRKFPDEKPEEDVKVLVYTGRPGFMSIQTDVYTKEDGFSSTREPRFRTYGPYVTHWMPLPSAPKEEK